ncbi:MAG: AAA family ATPase [Proteobacteria bacterium]|uniref:AAA family ATPase n=1 Tax=Candidatus Avisuccinivibrio stercorigallinarum TaxID=2840704 RepID=A0A9D9DC71_9GAMM|nr:AAA family ATPase [Candidatus Avisuccinivibrio stercorigallinarum]
MTEVNLAGLPLGEKNFAQIISSGRIYVDKTDLIAELVSNYLAVFFFRPSGFGKTTLVNTLHELFAHGMQSFRGLKIEKQGLWTEQKYKVLHLDFANLTDSLDIKAFTRDFAQNLKDELTANGIDDEIDLDNPIRSLNPILQQQQSKSLVLLIDNYDRPLSAVIADLEAFNLRQNLINRFFALLKRRYKAFRFIFVTGSIKFGNSGIYSAANNMIDISLMGRYGTLAGFTRQELDLYFKDYITNAAQVLSALNPKQALGNAELAGKMWEHYGGYTCDWLGSGKLYHPYSVLKFLSHPEEGFKSYLREAESAAPAALIEYLKHLRADFMAKCRADGDLNLAREITLYSSDLTSYVDPQINGAPARQLVLLQSGLLTIKAGQDADGLVPLGIPNAQARAVFCEDNEAPAL